MMMTMSVKMMMVRRFSDQVSNKSTFFIVFLFFCVCVPVVVDFRWFRVN